MKPFHALSLLVSLVACGAPPPDTDTDDPASESVQPVVLASAGLWVTVRPLPRALHALASATGAPLACAHTSSPCTGVALDLAPLALPASDATHLALALADATSARAFVLHGRLAGGVFAVDSAWRSENTVVSTSAIEQVNPADLCAFQPCAPLRVTALGGTRVRHAAGLDLALVPALTDPDDALVAASTPSEGVLVRGTLAPLVHGEPQPLRASQVYVRVRPSIPARACAADLGPAIARVTSLLLYSSESDRPFESVVLAGPFATMPDATTLATLTHHAPGTVTEVRDADGWFARDSTDAPDASPADRLRSARYRALRSLLTVHLDGVRVYRVGTVAIDVYVLGRDACGQITGVHTVAVET